MADVLIVVGSDSDVPVVQACYDKLKTFGVTVEWRIASSQRSPERLAELVVSAEAAGTQVFIAGAGGAAHLAGSIAAMTTKPVIGIPLAAGALGGVDALYSTVNMPPGVPVATVSVGAWGAHNAALLALQILGLQNPQIAQELQSAREQQVQQVLDKDAALQQQLD